MNCKSPLLARTQLGAQCKCKRCSSFACSKILRVIESYTVAQCTILQISDLFEKTPRVSNDLKFVVTDNLIIIIF